MLVGSATHTMDNKGRVVIPAKYREDLGSTLFLYITAGTGGCIRAYSKEQFSAMLGKLCAGDVTKTNFRRKLLAATEEVNIDSQGRVLIPENLRLAGGITDKVFMVGMVEWLEFWNEEKYKANEQTYSLEEEQELMQELNLS